MNRKQINKEIKRLGNRMVDHTKNLKVDKTAQGADQLHVLKQRTFETLGATICVGAET